MSPAQPAPPLPISRVDSDGLARPRRRQVIIRERLRFPSGFSTAVLIGVLHGNTRRSPDRPGLPVSGAFHTPFMAAARDRLRKAIDQIEIREPQGTVVANVDAQKCATACHEE